MASYDKNEDEFGRCIDPTPELNVKRQKTVLGKSDDISLSQHPPLEIRGPHLTPDRKVLERITSDRSSPADEAGAQTSPPCTRTGSCKSDVSGAGLLQPSGMYSPNGLSARTREEGADTENLSCCNKRKRRTHRKGQISERQQKEFDVTRLKSVTTVGVRAAGKVKPLRCVKKMQNGLVAVTNRLCEIPTIRGRAPIRRKRHSFQTIGLNHIHVENEQYTGADAHILFDMDEFNRLNYLYGPVTLDANADAYTSVHDQYCNASDRPFMQENLLHQTIWLIPPFNDSAIERLNYFEEQRKLNPHEISALIVIPKWPDELGKKLQEHVRSYKRIQTYPAGTYLFKQYVAENDEYVTLGPTPWEVEVYLADSEVEDREAQSINDQVTTAQLKQMGAFPYRKKKKDKNDAKEELSDDTEYFSCNGSDDDDDNGVKLRTVEFTSTKEPDEESPKKVMMANVTGPASEELLVLPIPIAELGGKEVHTLIDSGATLGFADETFVKRNAIPTEKCPQKVKCYLGDGATWKMATHQVILTLNIGGIEVTRPFIVTKLKYEIILGHDFLVETNPEINWISSTIRLRTDSAQEVSCTVIEREIEINVLSANQTKRILQKIGNKMQKNSDYDCQTEFFLGIIKAEPEGSGNVHITVPMTDAEENILNVTTDQTPEFTEMVRDILRKHSVIMEPLKGLPRSRPGFDHKIELKPDAPVPKTRIYHVSPSQLEELKRQIAKYLDNHWVRESFSEFASPILFVRKKNTKDLRMCVDFRRLNEIYIGWQIN